jgi:hypothetical protein
MKSVVPRWSGNSFITAIYIRTPRASVLHRQRNRTEERKHVHSLPGAAVEVEDVLVVSDV